MKLVKRKSKPMIRYKYLKDCQEGDWVYHEDGELVQVCKASYNDEFCLRSGYIETGCNNETTKVYPLTLHAKVLAEGIQHYDKYMHDNRLMNSRWANWLTEKFDELMALPDDAVRDDYDKIWDEIRAKIEELEYHKSFL